MKLFKAFFRNLWLTFSGIIILAAAIYGLCYLDKQVGPFAPVVVIGTVGIFVMVWIYTCASSYDQNL